MGKRDAAFYSVGDAARALAVSPSTVLGWCRRGQIVHSRTVGGMHLIRPAEIDRVLAERGRRASALAALDAESAAADQHDAQPATVR